MFAAVMLFTSITQVHLEQQLADVPDPGAMGVAIWLRAAASSVSS